MWIYKSGLSFSDFEERSGGYGKKYLGELRDEYEILKNTEIPLLSENDFDEFAESGRRIGYEAKYFLRRKMLRDFGLMMSIGNNEAALCLEKILRAVCMEKTWALPAHIGADGELNVIDLFAAETAQTIAEIISLTGNSLPAALVSEAVSEIKRRVLEPLENRKEKYGWERAKSNWSAVCGGCVGMTAIYLIEDNNRLLNITSSLEAVFESYMESFSEDGACLEGLYYWGYGMTYLTAFLDLYKERTAAEFNINHEKLKKMADFARKCCISDGATVSFSDGNGRDRIYSGLSSYLSERYGAESIPAEYLAVFDGDECGRWCRAARDIAWTRARTEGKEEDVSVLPSAQWAVMRGKEFSVAFKGGNNGEPHNHNDIGSFIAIKNGEAVLDDLGAGEYTREYFSNERYSIFCNSSEGHSVPIINGAVQKSGEKYMAKCFFARGQCCGADISAAYGCGGECLREIELCENGITLTDTYKLPSPACVTERFITRRAAVKDGNGVAVISDGGVIARVFANEMCEISSRIHREHDGTETRVSVIDYKFEASGEYVFKLNIE